MATEAWSGVSGGEGFGEGYVEDAGWEVNIQVAFKKKRCRFWNSAESSSLVFFRCFACLARLNSYEISSLQSAVGEYCWYSL